MGEYWRIGLDGEGGSPIGQNKEIPVRKRTVRGALDFLAYAPETEVYITGTPELEKMVDSADHPRLHYVPAKPNWSDTRTLFKMMKDGEISGVLTNGNNQVIVKDLVKARIERHDGIRVPPMILEIPTFSNKYAYLADAGASVEVDGNGLFQYAFLAAGMYHVYKNKSNPRVGFIANGEEPEKGTDATREAIEKLDELIDKGFPALNVGHSEPEHFLNGECDVIIGAGYLTNIVLKVMETMGKGTTGLIKNEMKRKSKVRGAIFKQSGKPAFDKLKSKLDVDPYTGAYFAGLKQGVVLKGHGVTTQKGVYHGLVRLLDTTTSNITFRMNELIEKFDLSG
jgi:fatty acid/phospholipid biosynthesis enzyme